MSACEKCGAPGHGRFCDAHRMEHGAHLSRQLAGIIAEHEQQVERAQAQSAAKIPALCGHSPSDLRVVEGMHFCGRCEDEAVSDDRP